MSRSPSQKIQQAMALWQTMPTAKLHDFVEAYKTQYGETISVPGAFIAKRRAGLTRKSKKSNRQVEMTIEQLQQVHQLAKDLGGIGTVRKQLKSLEALVAAAGGFQEITKALDLIEELKKEVVMPAEAIENFVSSLSKVQKDVLWAIVQNWSELALFDSEAEAEEMEHPTVAEVLESALDSA